MSRRDLRPTPTPVPRGAGAKRAVELQPGFVAAVRVETDGEPGPTELVRKRFKFSNTLLSSGIRPRLVPARNAESWLILEAK